MYNVHSHDAFWIETEEQKAKKVFLKNERRFEATTSSCLLWLIFYTCKNKSMTPVCGKKLIGPTYSTTVFTRWKEIYPKSIELPGLRVFSSYEFSNHLTVLYSTLDVGLNGTIYCLLQSLYYTCFSISILPHLWYAKFVICKPCSLFLQSVKEVANRP